MKKIIRFFCLLVVAAVSLTGCTTRSELVESEDTPEEEISESLFDSAEVTKTITEFARNHGMYEKNTLCYKSGAYYKLETTRYSSQFELQQAYEDAVRDLVAQGNMKHAKSVYFFVEPVITSEKGTFVIYIDYEFDFER